MKPPTLAQSCCTTPSAMCYWAGAFLILYGVGLVLGTIWPVFRQYGDTLILTALGSACVINFGRNRTLHCALTGPIFLLAAGIAAFVEAGVWGLDLSILWGVVLAAVGVAFIIEWRTFDDRKRVSDA